MLPDPFPDVSSWLSGLLHGEKTNRLALFAVCGGLLYASLHLYFAANWEEYVVSLGPGYRKVIEDGSMEPYMSHSPRSTWVGQIVILLVAFVAGTLSGKSGTWGLLSFWFGLFAVQLAILIFATRFPENLWPFALVGEVISTFFPVALGGGFGVAIAKLVRARSSGGRRLRH